MSHFWINRYVIDALLGIWIFMAVLLSRQGTVIWGLTCIWLGVMVLSSYTVTQAAEFDTIPWTNNAREALEEAQGERVVLYNFETMDVLYSYYLPDADFIMFDDVDLDQLTKDYDWVYGIWWGSANFSEEVKEDWGIRSEPIAHFTLEEGYANIELRKIYFTKMSD